MQRVQGIKVSNPHYETLEPYHLPNAQGHCKHFVGQFSVKHGVRTTYANFVIRTMCDKYREGNMHLNMLFVDKEGIYHTVPCLVL